jgi:hypothetical protein
MPVVSQAQNAAMQAAKAGHSTIGIPASVGRKFVAASKGLDVGKLPKHKPKAGGAFTLKREKRDTRGRGV